MRTLTIPQTYRAYQRVTAPVHQKHDWACAHDMGFDAGPRPVFGSTEIQPSNEDFQMKKQKISPAQLAENKLQARRLMEHMDRVTPGGIPPMVGPFRGVVTAVARVWAILIVALLLTTLGFQVSKSTAEAEAAPAPESTIKTLELPL